MLCDKYSNFIAGNHADLYPFALVLYPMNFPCLPKILFLRLNNLEIKLYLVVLEERKRLPNVLFESLSLILSKNISYILLTTIKASRCCRFLQIQGLQNQNIFVGYQSDPMSFISKLDVYLDISLRYWSNAFRCFTPGIPSVSVISPYECHLVLLYKRSMLIVFHPAYLVDLFMIM